jgi:hypothetical protein
MRTILAILKKAGGWHHGLYLTVEHPPHVALVNRRPSFSVRRSGRENPCWFLPATHIPLPAPARRLRGRTTFPLPALSPFDSPTIVPAYF